MRQRSSYVRREIQQGEIGFFVLALRAVVMEENNEQVITMYSSQCSCLETFLII